MTSEFESYLTKLLTDAESRCVVEAKSWQTTRKDILEGLKRTLGKDLPRQWPSLNTKVESVVQRHGYRIEQVSAEFWSGVRYAIQAYVPDGKPPFPGVVMACTGEHGPRHSLYQQLGGGLARMGMLVVGIVALGKGEASVKRAEAYQYNGIALLVGTSIAQEQFYTGIRALDYLFSRPDVDTKRVGITGDSDGGWVTLYVATVDPRITAAAPSSTNYTYCGYLLPSRLKTTTSPEGNPPEGLTYRANIPTLTACNAPKWFRFLNAEYETERLQFIPIIDDAASTAYALGGVPERYTSRLCSCKHGYWTPMQIEAISWFSDIFLGRRPPDGTLSLRPAPTRPFDQLLMNDQPVEVIWEEQEDWKRLQVGGLPDDGGKPAFLQIIETRRQDARSARAALGKDHARMCMELTRCLGIDSLRMNPKATVDGNSVALESEPDLRVIGEWVKTTAVKSPSVCLVVGRSEERNAHRHLPTTARFDLAMREEATLGPSLWALVMLNRPPLGMWVWDVMSAAYYLKRQGFEEVELVGVGDMGATIGVLGAVLSTDVDTVRLEGTQIRSLDEDVVGKHITNTHFWAHRLLWVSDLPELVELLKLQRRWRGR